MDQAQAEQFIVHFIRERSGLVELDLWKVLGAYIDTHEQAALMSQSEDRRRSELAPVFMAAAWDLATLSIVRPGSSGWPPSDDFDGTKYAVTPFGRRWVSEGSEDTFVPVGADTFIELLRPYAEFGEAFIERAKEAARCWKVHAYLACCVMCGAAAESILITAATAKTGNESATLSAYNSKGGRRKLDMLLAGQVRAEIKDSLGPLFGLVKYWRDEAGHGATSGIGQAEARTSLQALFLYARFVHRNWQEVTCK